MRFLKYLPFLLFFGLLQAQEEVVYSVYFDFDKALLNEKQASEVVDFMMLGKKLIIINFLQNVLRQFKINLF